MPVEKTCRAVFLRILIEPDIEYFVLGRDIKDGVAKTRGLKRLRPDDDNMGRTSEAVFLFTTSEKSAICPGNTPCESSIAISSEP